MHIRVFESAQIKPRLLTMLSLGKLVAPPQKAFEDKKLSNPGTRLCGCTQERTAARCASTQPSVTTCFSGTKTLLAQFTQPFLTCNLEAYGGMFGYRAPAYSQLLKSLPQSKRTANGFKFGIHASLYLNTAHAVYAYITVNGQSMMKNQSSGRNLVKLHLPKSANHVQTSP